MATKKTAMSMDDENMAFMMNAYMRDPKAKKAMDAEMKKLGITPEEFFGKALPKK